ncbi:hypothetical protein ACPCHT_20545 [Nucisporomicrobium flavum]|jgi:hypothetical protein|uniref:hypothetical protein n=1 Tax=Nucisporomicrobium flavum TaxID=2785915 RepID=UPI0018F63452|nr:hypothetical protein [Nucisporomicrobium flavum]
MDDVLTPGPGDDPQTPPQGYNAVECPACSTEHIKPSAAATALAVSVRAQHGATFCSTCNGQQWVWARKSLSV